MSSGIPLGQMLDMLESNPSKNSPKKTIDGNAVTGSYPTGRTGNLPVGGEYARRHEIQVAGTGSYGRLLETASGGRSDVRYGIRPGNTGRELGRIQAGTRRMLGLMKSSTVHSSRTVNQLKVSGAMIHAFGRTTTDPFYEAMKGFTKKAKKLSKRL